MQAHEIKIGSVLWDTLTEQPVTILAEEIDDEGFPVFVTDAPDKPHGVCRNPFELKEFVQVTLTFPTQAEQALAEFRAATKTTALGVVCARRGAYKEKTFEATFYTFDDDTSLKVTGRGLNHKVEVLLP